MKRVTALLSMFSEEVHGTPKHAQGRIHYIPELAQV